MSDKEININIRTTADTSGAEQTAEAISKTREAAQGAGESAGAINQVTDALNNAKTGAEEAAQAVVKETEAEQDNTQTTEKNTQSKGKSTSTKRKRKKATEGETKATRDNKKATEDATQAVDKDTKERTENTTAVEKQGNALENTGKKGEQAGGAVAKGGKQGTAAVKNMGNGALQAAYFFDDLQYGIRGVMNNIPGLVMGFGGGMGLAGALSMAVLAGKVLYDWLGDSADKSDELAKKMKEHSKEIADAAREAMQKSHSLMMDDNRNDRTKAIRSEFESFEKGITEEYRLRTQEVERQIQLRREEAARQKGIDTQEAELARVQLDNDFEDGKITKRQRDYGMMMINQNLDSKIRNQDLKTSQEEFMSYGDLLKETEKNRDSLQDKDFDMKFIQGQMPSLQEVRGLFNQQQKAQERIDASNSELLKTEERIRELEKEVERYEKSGNAHHVDTERKTLREFLEKQQRLLSARDTAQGEGNAATVRIDELRDLFRQSGVNFEPSYQKGTDVNSRAGEYQKALEDQNTNAAGIAKNLADASKEAGRLADVIGGYERKIGDQERGIRTQDRLNSGNIDLFNKRADKEEAKEAEKARKKLEKERERELKDLQRKQQQEANKAIKTFVEGFTLNAGKSATPRQTALVHKAIDGIRKDIERAAADGYVDPEEMQDLGKLFVGKVAELGVASRQVIQSLKQMFESNIGAINKEIAEIKRTQKMQLSRERLRR